MGLRETLRRLRREAREEYIEIPQRGGTVKKFPKSAGMEAYINFMDRMGAGEDAPPEHPMITAIRNSSDPEWQKTFFYVNDPDELTKEVEDLSQP